MDLVKITNTRREWAEYLGGVLSTYGGYPIDSLALIIVAACYGKAPSDWVSAYIPRELVHYVGWESPTALDGIGLGGIT